MKSRLQSPADYRRDIESGEDVAAQQMIPSAQQESLSAGENRFR